MLIKKKKKILRFKVLYSANPLQQLFFFFFSQVILVRTGTTKPGLLQPGLNTPPHKHCRSTGCKWNFRDPAAPIPTKTHSRAGLVLALERHWELKLKFPGKNPSLIPREKRDGALPEKSIQGILLIYPRDFAHLSKGLSFNQTFYPGCPSPSPAFPFPSTNPRWKWGRAPVGFSPYSSSAFRPHSQSYKKPRTPPRAQCLSSPNICPWEVPPSRHIQVCVLLWDLGFHQAPFSTGKSFLSIRGRGNTWNPQQGLS